MTAAAFAAPHRRSPPDPRPLQRCLLLAVLVHVWLVLMFGNATGTATPGQGAWGSLTVKLLGRSGSDAGAPPGAAAPAAPTVAAEPRPRSPSRPSVATPPADTPTEAADVQAAVPPAATLKLPDGFKPVERERIDAPPSPSPLQMPAAELPAAVRRLDDASNATAPRLQREATLRPAPAAAMATPETELPAPVRRLDAPAAQGMSPALPRAAELRSAPPATPVPVTTGAALPAPVQRLEAPGAAHGAQVAPLTRAGELRTPRDAVQASTALPSAQDLPAAVQRLEAPDSAVAPLQPATRSATPLAAPGTVLQPELSTALPGQVVAPAGPARGDPQAAPLGSSGAAAGTPDAGGRVGPDLPTPPTTAASAAPAPLNLSLPRGDMSSRRGPGLVELLPPPPERKSKLEKSIENAANPDCRKAYAGAGPLAVVPLVIDAVRGKGCNW